LYLQSFPPHEEHPEAKAAAKGQRFGKKTQDRIAHRAKAVGADVDWSLAEQVVNAAKGIAVPVTAPNAGFDAFLATARLVENRLPDDSNWDGSDRPVPIRDAVAAPAVTAPVASSRGQ
jgi:hypothetical protein